VILTTEIRRLRSPSPPPVLRDLPLAGRIRVGRLRTGAATLSGVTLRLEARPRGASGARARVRRPPGSGYTPGAFSTSFPGHRREQAGLQFFNVFSLVLGILIVIAILLFALARSVGKNAQSAHVLTDPSTSPRSRVT
jgi:hypothetical protein